MTDITIFTGITGIDKDDFIKHLIKKSGKDKKILYIDFESELTNSSRHRTAPTDMPAFLDMPNPYTKTKIIEDTFEWCFDKIIKCESEIEHIFFSIHLSYYKNSEFFPPFAPQLFSSHFAKISKPNLKIITLIDDVFSIWQRIKKKEQDGYLHTSMRLREILSWRSLESIRSESLNNWLRYRNEGFLSVNNYLVSVRHPYSTFHNLIFNEKPITVYLSYPITEPRKSAEGIKEINEYRAELHKIGSEKGAVVFDPVTIDELSLVTALNDGSAESKNVLLKEEHRWPLEIPDPVISSPNWPIEIPKQEIEEVKKDISNQIQSRDYALVDAANHLAVYRPFYQGIRSEGADAEIKHAKESGTTVTVYSSKNDESEAGSPSSPFASKTNYFQVKNKFIEHLQKLITKG